MPYRKFLSKNSIVGKVIKEVFFTRNCIVEADQNFGNYDVEL